MIFRRKTYRVIPEKIEAFNEFFLNYLLPNQLKNGARLVGRWVNEARDEIVAIWEYNSMEDYRAIEERVRQDELHQRAQARRAELGRLFIESRQDFLESTVAHSAPLGE